MVPFCSAVIVLAVLLLLPATIQLIFFYLLFFRFFFCSTKIINSAILNIFFSFTGLYVVFSCWNPWNRHPSIQPSNEWTTLTLGIQSINAFDMVESKKRINKSKQGYIQSNPSFLIYWPSMCMCVWERVVRGRLLFT